MSQTMDASGVNVMCCRAAIMTDCLIKNQADRQCHDVDGFEEIARLLSRTLVDPNEISRISLSRLQPVMAARVKKEVANAPPVLSAAVPSASSLRASRLASTAAALRSPSDPFSANDCKEFQVKEASSLLDARRRSSYCRIS